MKSSAAVLPATRASISSWMLRIEEPTMSSLALQRETDVDSRDALCGDHEDRFRSYLALVRHIALRIRSRHCQLDLDDLISAGVVGLLQALSKFDPDRKDTFKEYAKLRVRGAIIDSIRADDWCPIHLRSKEKLVSKAVRTLMHRHGTTPSEEEIAQELGMDLGRFRILQLTLQGLILHSTYLTRAKGLASEVLEIRADSYQHDPLLICMHSQLKTRLREKIQELSTRERHVILMYYFEELTMSEIGKTLGIAESRISIIHRSAVKNLRRALGRASKFTMNTEYFS